MKSSALIGLTGGIVIGFLQFFSMLHPPEGTFGMLLYYSPQIFYFMCIYMSVKIYVRNQPDAVPDFKGCAKAGGLTAVIISIIWGIGFFVSLTHLDVAADVRLMMATGHEKDVKQFLSLVTKQVMFDRTQFWVIPNFLLGFVMTILVTVIFRLRGKRAS